MISNIKRYQIIKLDLSISINLEILIDIVIDIARFGVKIKELNTSLYS